MGVEKNQQLTGQLRQVQHAGHGAAQRSTGHVLAVACVSAPREVYAQTDVGALGSRLGQGHSREPVHPRLRAPHLRH